MALETTLAAGIGALAGLVIVAVFDPHGSDLETLLFVIGGAMAGIALRRTLHRSM